MLTVEVCGMENSSLGKRKRFLATGSPSHSHTRHKINLSRVIEDLFKTVTDRVLAKCPQDAALFHKRIAPGHEAKLEKMLKNRFLM
ncbi:hypothetical protein Chor_010437 [Crotalus horridus]